MGFLGAIKTCYSKSFTFSGRASLSEYWWFVLFQFLVGIAISAGAMSYFFANPQILLQLKQDGTLPAGFMNNLWIFSAAHFLLLFMPGLSAMVRRLHDTDRSGWWIGGFYIVVAGLLGVVAVLLTSATYAGETAVGLTMIIFTLIGFGALIYSVTMIVFFCLRGTPGPNRFG